MRKLIKLDKIYDIKFDSKIHSFLSPEHIYIPIENGFDLLKKQNSKVLMGEAILENKLKKIKSSISGKVIGTSKLICDGVEKECIVIENNYEGLLEKTEYNTGIGKDIDKDTQDYYTFAIAYKKAVDYRVYVNNGENEKAEQVVKDIDNAQFNNVLFKEALENVKNIYISNGLSQ